LPFALGTLRGFRAGSLQTIARGFDMQLTLRALRREPGVKRTGEEKHMSLSRARDARVTIRFVARTLLVATTLCFPAAARAGEESETPCGCLRNPEWLCQGDVDGNGVVNPADSGAVQSAFCIQEECDSETLCQYDLDCNGSVNPVDAGLVQALFGTCDDVKDSCGADVDIDSDNTNGSAKPDRNKDEEDIEEDAPGRFINVNDDDDDENGVRDLDEEPIGDNPPEDDPVPLVVQLGSNQAGGAWRIVYPDTIVDVYDEDNVYTPSNTAFETPLEPNPHTFRVEGIARSTNPGDVVIVVEEDCDGDETFDVSDKVVATVLQVDIDVDSDNSKKDPDFAPDRTNDEDKIEDDKTKFGRVVCVNDGDDDNDRIADYGDGYNLDGVSGNDKERADDANAKETTFVRLVVEAPKPIDLTKARFRFLYDASDPADARRVGDPPRIDPAPGRLRIWKKNGNEARKSKRVSNGGDYFAPWVEADRNKHFSFKAADIGFTEDNNRTVNLWIEGIRPSEGKGTDRIVFEVDPDGADGKAPFAPADAVRVTVVQLSVRATAGLDAQKRVFTTLDERNARGVPGAVRLAVSAVPKDVVAAADFFEWQSIDVDDPADHIHVDPTDHDKDDNDGDGTADNNDGNDNTGILVAAHVFTEVRGFAIRNQAETRTAKDVKGDADIDDGAEAPMDSFTSITGKAETAVDANKVSQVEFNATNDGGDNFRIRATLPMTLLGGNRCTVTFPPVHEDPITVWRTFNVVVYSMNKPGGGVYYPFRRGGADRERFKEFVEAYDRAYISMKLRDADTPASLGSTPEFDGTKPYRLFQGDKIGISVDGGRPVEVEFRKPRGPEIQNWTADEIATKIRVETDLARRPVDAHAVKLSNNAVKLVIRSKKEGRVSSLKLTEVGNSDAARKRLFLPVDDRVTARRTTYFKDILDDNKEIQFEEYFQLQTDYHGSERTNPANPIDTVQLIGVERQEGYFGATCRQGHSIIAVKAIVSEGGSVDKTAIHEVGHNMLAGRDDFHLKHTKTPAEVNCAFEEGTMHTHTICPRHQRLLRNSIFRKWKGTDQYDIQD
jgi:hypothetical protein